MILFFVYNFWPIGKFELDGDIRDFSYADSSHIGRMPTNPLYSGFVMFNVRVEMVAKFSIEWFVRHIDDVKISEPKYDMIVWTYIYIRRIRRLRMAANFRS